MVGSCGSVIVGDACMGLIKRGGRSRVSFCSSAQLLVGCFWGVVLEAGRN
jgi:hypothetical protein